MPIDAVGQVGRQSVDVEGEFTQLWTPSHQAIQQVGLIEDDSGKIKFTVWRKSRQPTVREGDRARFRDTKRNLFRGRWSIALTSESRIVFEETVPRPDPAERVQGREGTIQRDTRTPVKRMREARESDDGPSRPTADAGGAVETELGTRVDPLLMQGD